MGWRCDYYTAIILGQKAAEPFPVLTWIKCPKRKRPRRDLLSHPSQGPVSGSVFFHMVTYCPAQHLHKPKNIPTYVRQQEGKYETKQEKSSYRRC